VFARGAWRLGAVVVPINHKLQAPEVSYILRHSGARLCLVDGARASLITAIEAEPQPLADMQAEHSFCRRRPGLLR
jgi:feruloyl-CoA synthase